MTVTYHRSMTDEERERYDALYQALRSQHSALCLIDRQLKLLNPAHARRFMSRAERRELRAERQVPCNG